MTVYKSILASVKKLHPKLSAQAQHEMAREWEEDLRDVPDSECLEHYAPSEHFTESV